MSVNLNKNKTIPLKDIVADIETHHILSALEESDWVQSKAARRLGISQRMLGYKIKKYGITLKQRRGGMEDDDEDSEKIDQFS